MNEATLFEREFELRFLKARGTAFQDLFSDVMERGFAADFQRVRPHGKLGDFKCDGFRRSDGTVFQVYGPDDFRKIANLLKKIKTDFLGAFKHWGTAMLRWVFVHNSQAGLPAPAVQLLGQLQTAHKIPIEPWNYTQLVSILRTLSSADLHTLFPLPSVPSQSPRLPSLVSMQRYWNWMAKRDFPVLKMTECLRRVDLPIRLITQAADREQRAMQDLSGTAFPTGFSPKYRHEGSRFQVDCYAVVVKRAIRKNRQLLILGDSGSGKTTLLRRLAVEGATRLLARGFRKGSRRTPVLIELWRFGTGRSIVDLVRQSFAESGCGVSNSEVDILLERGCLILLLDGLDEVASDLHQECLAQIGALSHAYPKSRFVVSSRQLPSLPKDFCTLIIGMLDDADITAAVDLFLPRGDLRFENYRTAEEYVRLVLRPSVRSLCRRPLTLAFLLSTLEAGKALPRSLYQIYERLLQWVLAWDLERDELALALDADLLLQLVSYRLCSRELIHVPVMDWTALAAPAVERMRALGSRLDPEALLRKLSAIGFLRLSDGDVGFAHRSVQEFLAARYLVSAKAKDAQVDPVALQPGVAAFLCSALPNATLLIQRHLDRCVRLEEVIPLLDECNASGTEYDEFGDLHDAIIIGRDMGVDLMYGMDGPGASVFIDRVEFLVDTCVEFGAKTIPVLLDAAHGIVFTAMWDQSRSWLDCIALGLELLEWGGIEMLREFITLGYFEHGEWIFRPRPCSVADEQEDTHESDGTPEDFVRFFDALYASDWSVASEELVVLRGRATAWLQDSNARIMHERQHRLDDEADQDDGLATYGSAVVASNANRSEPALRRFEPERIPPNCSRCNSKLRVVPRLADKFLLFDLMDGCEREFQIELRRYSCQCGATLAVARGPEQTSPGSRYSLRVTIRDALARFSLGSGERATPTGSDVESTDGVWARMNILARRVERSYNAIVRELRAAPTIHVALNSTAIPGWTMWHLRAGRGVAYGLSLPSKGDSLARFLGRPSGDLTFESWAVVYRWLWELGEKDASIAGTLDALRTLASPESDQQRQLGIVKTCFAQLQTRADAIGAMSSGVLRSWTHLVRVTPDWRNDSRGLRLATSVSTSRARYGASSRRDAEITAMLRTLVETASLAAVDAAEYLYHAATSDERSGVLPRRDFALNREA